MRSESSLCAILNDSAEVAFRKNSGSLEVDGCGVSSGVFSSSSSQSREKL
jgi:hypothetical protein